MRYAKVALTLLRLGIGLYLVFTAVTRLMGFGSVASFNSVYGWMGGGAPVSQSAFAVGASIFLGLLGAQASRPSPQATAYPHRDALYVMNVHTRWDDPADDARCIAWARDFFKDAAPYASGGVYVNFMPQDEGERTADAYGPNYQRLAQIKATYDPDNLFRTNQNIRPALVPQ